ncbi:hypothetical protein B0H67DRAFT_560150 [Lasiosphaeris hirsuta]|uniref:Uncharacterized protein n=1 Tax=Lasiosphaeris hirsuta TaxID=260670 RepID=A0AA40E9C2_9PEZI|nr:hypothetical protein B0H67DRAFT_560150 [Lasiosphaeris hirsuta]
MKNLQDENQHIDDAYNHLGDQHDQSHPNYEHNKNKLFYNQRDTDKLIHNHRYSLYIGYQDVHYN